MTGKSSTRRKGERSGETPDDENQRAEDSGPPSWLERVATIFSGLLVVAILGILIRDAARPDAPPAFQVVAGRVDSSGATLRVPVEVRNTGDEAAHQVHVHIELRGADSLFAETELTIDWLAGRSKHDVVGFFEKPTLPFTPHAEVRGYSEP